MNESYAVKWKLNWLYLFVLPTLVGIAVALSVPLPTFLKVYLLIILIGVVLSILFLTNMKNTLLVLILLRPSIDLFQDIRVGLGGFGVLNLAGMISLMVVFGGLLYIVVNKVKISSLPEAKAFLAFILLTLTSLIFSQNVVAGLQEWLRLLGFFIIYVLATQCLKEKKHINQLITVIFISILLPSMVAFYQLFTRTGFLATPGFNRIKGTFTHPVPYSYYLLLVMTLAIILIFDSKKLWKKLGMILLYLPMSILLFNTFTRAAWIGLVLTLFLFGMLRYRRLLLILPLVFLILALTISSVVFGRFADLFNPKPYGPGNSMAARVEVWKDTYPLFLKSPVIGNGWGRNIIFEQAETLTKAKSSLASLSERPTHNDYLRVLVEVGILGLAAYLWLLFSVARCAWHRYTQSSDSFLKSLTLGFWILTVLYMTLSIDSNLIRNMAFQWSFWTLAAAVYKTPVLEKKVGDDFNRASY